MNVQSFCCLQNLIHLLSLMLLGGYLGRGTFLF